MIGYFIALLIVIIAVQFVLSTLVDTRKPTKKGIKDALVILGFVSMVFSFFGGIVYYIFIQDQEN